MSENIGRVGTIVSSSFFFSFFTLKKCQLYYKNCIFLVFSENVEMKIRIH